MPVDLILRGERVFTPIGERHAAVHVDRGLGTITAVTEPADVPSGTPVTELGKVCLLPGLVDSHVHINDPGRTDWEGFETATLAAAAGGYTMLVDMPLNCVPATTSVPALEGKRAAALGRCQVDWAAWGGVVHDNQDNIASLAAAGVRG